MTRLMYSSYIIARLSILTEVTMDTMTFGERNVFLSSMWKELSEEELNEFNRSTLSEDVITEKEQIKRTLKSKSSESLERASGKLRPPKPTL